MARPIASSFHFKPSWIFSFAEAFGRVFAIGLFRIAKRVIQNDTH